jgi:hypothetical protein
MNKKQLLLSTVALGCAAMLLAPAEASFSTIGGSLGVGQRDVRVFNNFSDVGTVSIILKMATALLVSWNGPRSCVSWTA